MVQEEHRPLGQRGSAMQPREQEAYIVVKEFMTRGLGLHGLPLLVYARVHGFCEKGDGVFYESKRRVARILDVDTRSVVRAFNALVDEGLIFEEGEHEFASKVRTKVYALNMQRVEEAKSAVASADRVARVIAPSPDVTPWEGDDAKPSLPMARRHPIPKKENKNF